MKKLPEMIEVMTAAEDGKEIECIHKGGDNWGLVTKPLWNWASYDYSIKKEPRVFYIVDLACDLGGSSGMTAPFMTLKEAQAHEAKYRGEIIELKEVLK